MQCNSFFPGSPVDVGCLKDSNSRLQLGPVANWDPQSGQAVPVFATGNWKQHNSKKGHQKTSKHDFWDVLFVAETGERWLRVALFTGRYFPWGRETSRFELVFQTPVFVARSYGQICFLRSFCYLVVAWFLGWHFGTTMPFLQPERWHFYRVYPIPYMFYPHERTMKINHVM